MRFAMVATKPCLDDDSLERLVLGQMPETESETLWSHVAGCVHCSARADTRIRSDPIVAATQAQPPQTPMPDDSALVRAMGQLAAEAMSKTLPGPGLDANLQAELAALNLAPDPNQGGLARFEQYNLKAILGRGGMGIVFRAEDTQLRREVAIKVMRPMLAERADARERFLREARAIAALDHEGVVPIFHVGEAKGVPYLVMPLLKGESLQSRLGRERVLTPEETRRVGIEVARALAAAHERGILHRDVKPGNIWIEAPTGRAKLLDFGLARAAESEQTTLTHSGALVGTPAYMAPEQAANGNVDSRSDLFGLGCVLYEAATGQRPFKGANVMEVLQALANHVPPPPGRVRPDLPHDLSQVIARLLEKDPLKRIATGDEVAQRLAPTPAVPKIRLSLPWCRIAVAAGSAAALILLVMLGVKFFFGGKVNEGPPPGPAATGAPLFPTPLVLSPTKIDGVESWDIVPITPTIGRTYWSARLSPDRAKFALGDGLLVRIYDLKTNRLLQVWPGLTFAWSPDSESLAISGHKGLSVIDLATGTKAFADQPAAAFVMSVVWSSEGSAIAACTDGFTKTIVLDAKTGKEISTFDFGWGARVAFSPDGKSIAGWTKDGIVRMGDVATGKVLPKLAQFRKVHPGFNGGPLAFSPKGNTLAAFTSPHVLLIDVETGAERASFETKQGCSYDYGAWTRDDKWLVNSSYVVDLEKKTVTRAPEGCLLLDEQLALKVDPLQLQLVDGRTGAPRHKFSAGMADISHAPSRLDVAALSPNNSRLVVGKGFAVDMRTKKTHRISRLLGGFAAKLDFFRDDDEVLLDAPAAGKCYRTKWDGEELGAFDIALARLSPDRTLLVGVDPASPPNTYKMQVRDMRSGKTTTLTDLDSAPRTYFSWSQKSDKIAVVQEDNAGPKSRLRIWDLKRNQFDEKEFAGFSVFHPEGPWSPDGTHLIVASEILDLASNKLLRPPGAGQALAWSKDGSKFYAFDAETLGNIAAYDWAKRERLESFPTHYAKDAWFLRWSDDRGLVTYQRDGAIWLSRFDQKLPDVGFVPFTSGQLLMVSPEGHVFSQGNVENEIAYVVRTAKGQEVLTPAEFAAKHGWKNDPERVRIIEK